MCFLFILVRKCFIKFSTFSRCDLPVTYDLLCPGFEPQAMKKILEILYTGETYLDTTDNSLYFEMRSILDALQISMALPDLSALNPIASDLDISDDCLELPVMQRDFYEPVTDDEYGTGTNLVPSSDLETVTYRCSICEKEYSSEQLLENHSNSHTSDDSGLELTTLGSTSIQSESMNSEQSTSKNKSYTFSRKKKKSFKKKANGKGLSINYVTLTGGEHYDMA